MALTLQERVNLAKGLQISEISTAVVTPVEKIDAQLKKLAGEITQGTLLRAEIPNILVHNPSDAQLQEWCNRIQDNSGMSTRMISSIISYAVWDTDGVDILDAPIRTTCLNCIASYAKRI
jgi:hypothetical protein